MPKTHFWEDSKRWGELGIDTDTWYYGMKHTMLHVIAMNTTHFTPNWWINKSKHSIKTLAFFVICQRIHYSQKTRSVICTRIYTKKVYFSHCLQKSWEWRALPRHARQSSFRLFVFTRKAFSSNIVHTMLQSWDHINK